jgi:uncharacterized damage-inducible protein DinB
MKTSNRVTKGRNGDACLAITGASNAEQVDRAENEAMTKLSKKSSTKKLNGQKADETTTLERRVLAHERILKSLIAHMTETDHRFLDRLRETYCIKIKYREQDYTDTEDFAEEFVHAIEESVQQQHEKTLSQAYFATRGRKTPDA